MAGRIVGLAGSLSKPSRTRALVEAAVERAADRYWLDGEVFDLEPSRRPSAPRSGLADLGARRPGGGRDAADGGCAGAGEPGLQGQLRGLFKHLLDLLDPLSLVGKPVLLGATGGGPRHALVIEHQLRPLLGFFEAQTLATGIYAADSDFRDGVVASAAAIERLDRAVAQFAPFLGRPCRRPPARRPMAVAALS